MTYTIPYQASLTAQGNIVVADSTINTTSTSLALIGANSVNFGLYVNQDFVNLLQNFAKNTAPTSPLIGQLWYDTISESLKYYTGSVWQLLTPPFDGAAGTATLSLAGGTDIALTLANNQIIYAVSAVTIPQAGLPDSVLINSTSPPYALASRFPQGLGPGITLATTSGGFQFYGTAKTANALASNMTLSVSGSASGSVSFNGSSGATLPVNLNSVVAAGHYTNVTVGSNGIVIAGGSITSNDVTAALGYTPGVANGPANVLTFGSNIKLDGVIGGSNVFYGNRNIIIHTTFIDNPMPTNGIILLPVGSVITTGWYIANVQTATIPNGGGSVVTETLTAPAGTNYIQKVY